MYYELANAAVNELLLSLWKTGEQQLADIQKIKEQFLNPHSDFHTISLDEALAKCAAYRRV